MIQYIQRYSVWAILSIILFVSCATLPPTPYPVQPPDKPPIETVEESPTVKIGLVWGIQSIDLIIENDCFFLSHDGTFAAKGLPANNWHAEVTHNQAGKVVYRLVAGSMSTRTKAEKKSRDIRQKGFETEIIPVKQGVDRKGFPEGKTLYRIYLSPVFDTRDVAQIYRDQIKGKIETFITSQVKQKAKGIIRLTNPTTMQYFEATQAILVYGSSITLENIPVGKGYHWEHLETRRYPADIRLEIGSDGQLVVINQLPIEDYLKGVVPSEMPAGFPLEALKAQAVAARSETMAKLGLVHQTDPFDLCADVHCQVYSGYTKQTPQTSRAVEETHGVVLYHKDEICDAVYSSVCGGHTESNDLTWGGEPRPYLQGVWDGHSQLKWFGDLSQEHNLHRWIDDTPNTYCNPKGEALPTSLDYTRKYVQWKVSYSQNELRNIIEKKTGKSIGPILDLLPIERGVSGRIILLKIVGQNGEIEIERELNIRKTLSDNTLWSSCFYIRKMGRRNGVPELFILKGKGFGHGVGMCQTGAAVMALKGNPYNKILGHYYTGSKLKKVY